MLLQLVSDFLWHRDLYSTTEELAAARWAMQFRIVGADPVVINDLSHHAATELDLTSVALLHQLTARQAVDDRDEFAGLACRAVAPLSQILCLRGVLHVTSSRSY